MAQLLRPETPHLVVVEGMSPLLIDAGYSTAILCYDHWKVSSIPVLGMKDFRVSVRLVILPYFVGLFQNSLPLKNLVNVTLCQHYPDPEDLTLTEEYLIAMFHPVGVVIKLQPGGQASAANQRAIRGHFIIIPQDLKPPPEYYQV